MRDGAEPLAKSRPVSLSAEAEGLSTTPEASQTADAADTAGRRGQGSNSRSKREDVDQLYADRPRRRCRSLGNKST
jgi:hypothetical protein